VSTQLGPLFAWGLALFLSVLAGAGDARAETKTRSVLVMNLEANHVDANTVNTLQSLLTFHLDRYPSFGVMGGQDVRRMLDLEAQKESAGCDDESACVAEIADALGAELVVTGEVGRIQSKLILNLNLIDSKKQAVVGRAAIKADDLGSMTSALDRAVAVLVKDVVLPGEAERLADAEVEAKRSSGPWPWITMGTGTFTFASCCVGSCLPGLIWTAGMIEAEALRTHRDGWARNTTTPKEAREMREAHDESIEQWNGGMWQFYWVMVGIAAVGLVAGTTGLIWGLAE
jgi:TolB-like protein